MKNLTQEEAVALRTCGRSLTLWECMEVRFWEKIAEMTDENGVVQKPTMPPVPPLFYDASGSPVYHSGEPIGEFE